MPRNTLFRIMIVVALMLAAIYPLHLGLQKVAADAPALPPAAPHAVVNTYTNSTSQAIPDGVADGCDSYPGTPVVSTITVPDSGTIGDVNINLNIWHEWVGDVSVQITSPAGTTVTLVYRPGWPDYVTPGIGYACYGFNTQDITTLLDDESLGGPVDDANPPTGPDLPPKN